MKVSYCIMCKGRTYHLKETLPRNLDSEKRNENVEFVVLNYDSGDGLADWMNTEFADEIACGRVVHVHFQPAPTFKMAHAKNMSHRAATGDILCNLDADNLIVADFSAWLRAEFSKNSDVVISSRKPAVIDFLKQRWLNKRLGLPSPPEGLSGRIAIKRENFHRLGGYDEGFSAWGMDDIDFICRARDFNLPIVSLPPSKWGDVLLHNHSSRVVNLSESDKTIAKSRLDATPWAQFRRRIGQLNTKRLEPANLLTSYGRGAVRRNFSDKIEMLG